MAASRAPTGQTGRATDKAGTNEQPTLSSTNWPAVAVIVGSGVVAAFQVGKAVIAVPALRADLGLDLTAAGWIMAIFALLGVVGGIPVGVLVGRLGARNLLLAGLLAITLGSAIGGAAHSFALLLGMRIVEGFGFVLVTIAAPSMLRHVIAIKDRDLAFGIWAAYMPLGMALILGLGGFIHGWRGIWWAAGALAAIAAVLVFAIVPSRSGGAVPISLREIFAGVSRTMRNAGSALVAACFATYTMQYFALFSFLPVLLIERLGVTVAVAGTFTAMAAVSNALGTLVAGVLLSRGLIARWALLALASTVMGACAMAIFIGGLPNAVLLVLCVVFAGVGGTLPSTLMGSAPMLSPTPQLAPVAIGLAMQGSYLGQVLAPLAMGPVVDTFGWSAAAGVVAVAALLGVTCAWRLRPIFGKFA